MFKKERETLGCVYNRIERSLCLKKEQNLIFATDLVHYKDKGHS